MTIPDSRFMLENAAIGIPYTPEEEKRIVSDLVNKAELDLKVGNLYYVVSTRWFSTWQKYTGQEIGAFLFSKDCPDTESSRMPNTADRPGPIDNSDIVENGDYADIDQIEISKTLEEGRDYFLVPKEAWDKLHQWYGGGPALPRKVISQGVDNKKLSVEVFSLCLKLIDSKDNSQSVIRMSKQANLHELYERVCKLRNVDMEKARIWDYFNETKQSVLTESDKTLEESNLQMNQDILLEVQVDGFWPSGFGMDSTGNEMALVPVEPLRSSLTIAGGPSISNGYSSGYGSGIYQGSVSSGITDMEGLSELSTSTKRTEKEKGGLAGLQNLGNTCFMNSALQCLVHTPPLFEYFLGDYTSEINRQNPLGLHGELAIAFGDLLRKLWSSGRTPVPPRAFKGKLARFAPQFSGYNQHDSQELLAFLLDGLHEDLNRVKQKPYIETKDFDGRPDEEVADECWRYHKARNDSIIVDVCQGQYKSTLVCPECNKISITFDPFMYLSLPLPSTVTRSMTVYVFYTDGSGLPMPFTVTVLKHGSCKDLSQALATECCLRTDESLLLAEVYDHKIYRYLDSHSLTTIKDDERIVAYRLPKNQAKLTRLEICHRQLEKCMGESIKASERKLFLTPLVTCIEDLQTGADIYQAVNKVLLPLRKTYFIPSKVDEGKENGTVTEAAPSSKVDNLSEDAEMEEASSEEEFEYQLCLSDDKGFSCRPLNKDSPLKAVQMVKVMLDWTDREFKIYDNSYLKDLPEAFKSGHLMKKTRQEAVSLFSCLDAFLKEEPLGPEDMWYCPGCKEHRQATKKLDLWRLPEILVFHLKRFSYSRYLKNKLDTFVNFPVDDLDLSKYVKCKDPSGRSHIYDLYAISNHYGGLGGGHYSAYAKLVEDERWYHFDDSHVSQVNESEIKTTAAYVLFYQRRRSEGEGPSNVLVMDE
ncbi:ubiquitin carboxyl-terminal hydrolase 9-like [Impatiens glandulifera]|uniref:ubiquitin carboxyl-terminal hydrolase 9-like n=1 Tax=Impatiens glandulifera TaxID=253017 RepID=UPI001FB07D97|nr:ubiquitin carboxyl-terminal hydrolase 9-like [Impatiens glandulifera]XP_047315716.1 ubiquitin carboxyl-terminal hydrolase 9-like [Impatiens glandulifera]